MDSELQTDAVVAPDDQLAEASNPEAVASVADNLDSQGKHLVLTAQPYLGEVLPNADYRKDFTLRFTFGRLVTKMFLSLTCGYRLEGVENIPAQGPAILVCNHQALLDPPLISAAVHQRQVQFIAKTELQKIPFVGWVLKGCRCVWVDRRARDGKALSGAFKVLENKQLLGVFPEGTRSKTGKLLPAHAGAAVLALRSGAPVVPAAVYNTREMVQHIKFPWGCAPVGLRFGKPICFEKDENPSRERINEVKAELMYYIAELLEKGIPEQRSK